VDPGRDNHDCLFYQQSRAGKVFRPKKECLSLLKRYMSQQELFRDHMYKSKQICPTSAPTSLKEEGINVELWRRAVASRLLYIWGEKGLQAVNAVKVLL